MSLEHIWPRSLGGAQAGELFRSSSVCQTCNNLAGLWVDGAYLKSWFIAAETAGAARQFLDPTTPGILPLTYMGMDQEFPSPADQECERWIGPAGEHVYHVHFQDADQWYGFAGGDMIRRKKLDPGRAYLVLTSKSPYWVLTGLQSFITHFTSIGARIYCLSKVEGMPPELANSFLDETASTDIESKEIAWIRAAPNDKVRMMRLSVRLDFSDRFMAKLSLGLGANILGGDYLKSLCAEELRKILWPRQMQGTSQPPKVHGSNYWKMSSTKAPFAVAGLPGAWTILLHSGPQFFSLCLLTPGGHPSVIAISDDNSLWSGEGFEQYKYGIVYFAVPQRHLFVGPVAVPRYLNHKNGHLVEPEISRLEALRGDSALLPKQR
jgi:hypothetical protein